MAIYTLRALRVFSLRALREKKPCLHRQGLYYQEIIDSFFLPKSHQ